MDNVFFWHFRENLRPAKKMSFSGIKMSETDRQTDKSTRFAFTAFEKQWYLFANIKQFPDVAEWGWQTETCPTSGTLHYQGYMRTKRQFRVTGVRKMFPGVNLSVARDWHKLRSYCRKKETSIDGSNVYAKNDQEYWSLERLMIELTNHLTAASIHINQLLDQRVEVKDISHETFWFCARQILHDEPHRASALNQPSIEKFFKNTLSVWTCEETRAIVLQPAQEVAATEGVELNSPELI